MQFSLAPCVARRAIVLSLSLALGVASPARAEDGLLKSLFEIVGFATPDPPTTDFVVKSRAAAPKEFIPVFQPPGEPVGRVKKPTEIDAMRSDLAMTQAKHDALLASFAPSAKAVAEANAAKAKKKKRKPPPPAT